MDNLRRKRQRDGQQVSYKLHTHSPESTCSFNTGRVTVMFVLNFICRYQVDERTWDFTQRQTEEEIQMKKKKKDSVTQKHLDKARLIQQKSQSNVSLLAKIFNSSKSQ